MATIRKEEFIQRYSAAVAERNAALFVGAGFSQPSGFVNWKDLLRDIAADLGLDIDQESDLVSIAQYHVNERGGRARINEILIDEFNRNATPTINHSLVASLPLDSIWTTNYDSLIEDALVHARKRPDVKVSKANLAQVKRGRDIVVYKMHGDKSQPQDAVLTREDYETYSYTREPFSIALQGDLIEKTFLFLGFSFTDPNIEYVLSRIKALMGQSQRDHFCIMKRPDAKGDSPANRAEHEYIMRKLNLRISDLNRYRIQTVLIDSYHEITELLQQLNARVHLKDVCVSGSSADPHPFTKDRLDSLARDLGAALIKAGFNLISGFGLGIGSSVAYGALNEVYSANLEVDRVRLMPFPKASSSERSLFNTRHRETMISQCGFVIFLAGNKPDEVTGTISNAPGVLEEFALTLKAGRVPIPVGASGWMSAHIWNEVRADVTRYYGQRPVTNDLDILGDSNGSNQDYVEAVIRIIRCYSR